MMAPLSSQLRCLCGLLIFASACTYWTLFAAPFLETAQPESCANLTALPPAVPSPAFFGVGVFATRRRYQVALDRLKGCVAERHARIRSGAGPVCDLAVASSNWRIFVREDARASANLVARRFSHFLDCGAKGWFTDCASKSADYYFTRYASDFDCARKAPTRCEPLCEHLLEQSGKSRASVDTLLSPRRAVVVRAVLGAAAALGVVGLVRPPGAAASAAATKRAR